VKWVHTHKLRGRSFWDIPYRGNMTWGWRKLLQVRPIVRQFLWYQLGDGNSALAWVDRWDPLCPLKDHIMNRDIYSAGFGTMDTVSQLLQNGFWKWLNDWFVKYPFLNSLNAPTITLSRKDELVLQNDDGTF
jgi:hypothetical protein